MAFGWNVQALKSGQGIVLDLDFQDLMTEQETRSLVGQLQFAYAANCKAEVPAHLYFTSLNVSAAVSSLPLGRGGSLADVASCLLGSASLSGKPLPARDHHRSWSTAFAL